MLHSQQRVVMPAVLLSGREQQAPPWHKAQAGNDLRRHLDNRVDVDVGLNGQG
jgi:hypothetical protein